MCLAEKIVAALQNSETHHESLKEAVKSLSETDEQVAIYVKKLSFEESVVTVPRHGDLILGFRSQTACEPHLYAVEYTGRSKSKGVVELEPGKFTACYIPLMQDWNGLNMNYWSPQLVIGTHNGDTNISTTIDVVYAVVKDNHGLHFGKYNLSRLPALLDNFKDAAIWGQYSREDQEVNVEGCA